MSLAPSPVVGTIRVEPSLTPAAAPIECDDSTLELLLAGWARCPEAEKRATDERNAVRLLTCTRLSRWRFSSDTQVAVQANLAQLLMDLEAEYEQLGSFSDAS